MIPKPTRFTKIVRKMIARGFTEQPSTLSTYRLLDNLDALDQNRVHRDIVHRSLGCGRHSDDAIDDIHAREYAAEDRVAKLGGGFASVVEHAVVDHVDIKLRCRTAKRPRPRHRERAARVVQAVRGFVLNRRPRGLLLECRCKAPALDHESLFHAVKHRPGIKPVVHVLQKILNRNGGLGFEELDRDIAERCRHHHHRVPWRRRVGGRLQRGRLDRFRLGGRWSGGRLLTPGWPLEIADPALDGTGRTQKGGQKDDDKATIERATHTTPWGVDSTRWISNVRSA